MKTAIVTFVTGMAVGVSLSLGITHSAKPLPPAESAWNSKCFVLDFHNHIYDVSTTKVTNVGRYLTPISYHGRVSGAFKLYAMSGISGFAVIAVATDTGYLLAIEHK